jgi:enamine deaminase RidA (YjgF/YER057c/UK114 family)
MSIKVIVPEESKASYEQMHFAPAVEQDGFIFCSGCVGQAESAEEEFRQAWQQIGAILAEAGCGYEDIVDSTLYMVDLQSNAAAMFKVKDEFIKAPYPASTWIGITELVIPGARAEIKVTARKPR